MTHFGWSFCLSFEKNMQMVSISSHRALHVDNSHIIFVYIVYIYGSYAVYGRLLKSGVKWVFCLLSTWNGWSLCVVCMGVFFSVVCICESICFCAILGSYVDVEEREIERESDTTEHSCSIDFVWSRDAILDGLIKFDWIRDWIQTRL